MTGQAFVAESVLVTLRAFAEASRPLETGGVLVGVLRDDQPWITTALEIQDPVRTSSRFVIPRGATPIAIDVAREKDPRVGYLGDWHSHPANLPASGMDRTTLRRTARRRGPSAARAIMIVIRDSPDGWQVDALEDDGKVARPIDLVATGDLRPHSHLGMTRVPRATRCRSGCMQSHTGEGMR